MAAVLPLPSSPGLVPRAGRSGRSAGARRPHATRWRAATDRRRLPAASVRRRGTRARARGGGGPGGCGARGSSLAPAERRPQVTSVVVRTRRHVVVDRRRGRARRRSARRSSTRSSPRAAPPACAAARRSPGSAGDRDRPRGRGRCTTRRSNPGVRWIRALPVLPGERRQGRGLARRRRRRCDPAPARVPRLRSPLHDLRAASRKSRLLVVKRSGEIEPFDRAKLRGRYRARGAPAGSTTGRSTRSSARSRRSCGPRAARSRSERVGLAVLERLRSLDHVAYLRFASVYKGFEDLADFEREVVELQKTTAPKQRRTARSGWLPGVACAHVHECKPSRTPSDQDVRHPESVDAGVTTVL